MFRLETGAKRLELRPTPSGVLAVLLVEGREQESTPIDLSSDPVKLAEKWLEVEKNALR
jgi:tRNA(Ser,Leu) C12 N-acetylase TAN1